MEQQRKLTAKGLPNLQLLLNASRMLESELQRTASEASFQMLRKYGETPFSLSSRLFMHYLELLL